MAHLVDGHLPDTTAQIMGPQPEAKHTKHMQPFKSTQRVEAAIPQSNMLSWQVMHERVLMMQTSFHRCCICIIV
jgi:hypothetical protein